MTSFLAKIREEMLRKRENKKKKSFGWVPTCLGIKNSKKIKKIKKHHYNFFSSQNRLGKADKGWQEKKSFRWVFTWPGLENSK